MQTGEDLRRGSAAEYDGADGSAAQEKATQEKYAETGRLDKRKKIPEILYLALCCVFMVVMLATGYNFLPLVGLVLGVVAALVIFIRILQNRSVSLWCWISFLVIFAGTFVYFLIWSAEPFGKRLWWNLVLIAAPVLLAVALVFLRKGFGGKRLKALAAVTVFLMIGTTLVYALFMNLRVRPTVDRMWEGHDDYLNSVKKADADAPNVLFVLMDDMAYADISSYSYLNNTDKEPTINTPNIDSIADGGIMMDNFYSSSPVCSPSRFSILTGRYSSRGYLDNVVFPSTVESDPWSPTHFLNPYQFLNNVDGILGDEITFAEVLQRAGYSTACIGKWNLGDYGEYLPTNQGFDYFYGSYYVNDMTPYNWVRDTGGNHPDGVTHEEVRSHKENLDQSESTKLFTAEMVNFISSSIENDEKFLAYYTSPWPHYPIFSDNNGNGKGDKSDDSYIDCIEEFDRGLGEIIQVLKDTGEYDNTVIIFTSDNGPGREGATGALRGRKNTTFEGGMKVPLLVSYPAGGVGQGTAIESENYTYYPENGAPVQASTKRIEASSMNFDLFTTILSLCGIRNDDGSVYLPSDRIIDGKDLTELWRADVPSDTRLKDDNGEYRVLYYQKKGKTQGIQMPVEVEVDGVKKVFDFKYYDRVQTENSAFIDQYYKNYLFNLDEDPIEGYNVSMWYPEVAEQLNAQLKAFRKEMKTNRRGIL